MVKHLTRWDFEWCPDVDDDNDYVWRNGYWEIENWDERNENTCVRG